MRRSVTPADGGVTAVRGEMPPAPAESLSSHVARYLVDYIRGWFAERQRQEA